MESEVINENIEAGKKNPVSKARKLLIAGICLLLLGLVLITPLFLAPAFQEMGGGAGKSIKVDSTLLNDKVVQAELSKLKTEISRLDKKLDGFLPHDPYIIVNTVKNHFQLFNRNGSMVREGFCSSGSYTKLVSEKKTWIFKTPRGRMTVLAKTENPVWSKPDWAFVEEGLPIPPAGHPSRYEKGVLGAYKLTMADGYLLHGTLYKRFLGMPVTHGCVRLGDEDLEVVYHTLNVGSYVYIY